ncbi:hypothetical protein POM88_017843 [Heracleum sosnowskyi]|uniref:RNA-dependent RNA polymerase n=1 Tax=Heracleum sosnowskyi TaxID=360622 RepID=A0AAD8ITA1_9APIA|nr:hypothetical protein POM88_017843 [Heracleum sosnowskyi]
MQITATLAVLISKIARIDYPKECRLFENGSSGNRDMKIGKVCIRLSTLETGRVYTHSYPFLVLHPSGVKKMGELYLAISLKHISVATSVNHGTVDDEFTTARIILSGVPLDESCVQHRLSHLAFSERKGLQEGRLLISDSYFLMGTADPTGLLNSDEVCVIFDNGQISGNVLVYQYPGLHFGDIHVLKAVYLKELEDVVGNAKYAIALLFLYSEIVLVDCITLQLSCDVIYSV